VNLDRKFEERMARFDATTRVIDARLSRAEATYRSTALSGEERQAHDQRDRVSATRAEIMHVGRFWSDREAAVGEGQL
jgi:RNase H-fold protein (predicted Holliday junction resolvase)